MKNILEIKDVSLNYQTKDDEINAIKDLNLFCKQGDFLSIIGPSGCGKTSILSMISGLLKPSKGEIIYNNQKVNGISKNLGYMFQKDCLFPWLTIQNNIILPLKIKKLDDKNNIEFVKSLLKKYGLYDFRDKYPNQLSGGMRQRASLIRTLSFKPDLLLLDEPFSALDSQTRLSVSDDVFKIIKEEQKTAILVTHDISESIAMSDIIVVLTNRPAKVKCIFTPNIEGTPIKKRESQYFGVWFEKIWKELNK